MFELTGNTDKSIIWYKYISRIKQEYCVQKVSVSPSTAQPIHVFQSLVNHIQTELKKKTKE